MSRSSFRTLSVVFWTVIVAVLVGVRLTLGDQFGTTDGINPMVFYGGSIGGVLVGIILNTVISDMLFATSMGEGDAQKMTPEARRRFAEAQAAEALASGNVKLAVVAFENGGMLDRALALAQEKGEHALAARLLLRQGRKDQARKCFVRAQDFFMAGHLSLQLKEYAEARQHYATHLDHHGQGMKVMERAGLMDRAGQYVAAAAIYEENGNFVRAADAWLLAGDPEKAVRATEKASVLAAYEKGKQTGAPGGGGRTRLLRDAEMSREAGDLFAAAWGFREGGAPAIAAEIFEGIDEWVRAAACHEAAGDAAKAAAARAKAKLPEFAPPPPAERPAPQPTQPTPPVPPTPQAPGPPSPQMSPPGPPTPASIANMAPPPIFLAPSAMPAPAAWHSVATGALPIPILPPAGYHPVGKGASMPTDAKGWHELAQRLALQGNLSAAADIHLQGGDLANAVSCLADAGRGAQAALVAMGGGDYGRAATLLVEQLERDTSPKEQVGQLLGQLLVNLKEYALAEQLLRKRLAPQVNEKTAGVVYQFARMLEDAGALPEAERLYDELLESGATSEELEERLASLRRRMESRTVPLPDDRPHEAPMLTSQIRRKLSAWDFLQAMIESDDDVPLPPGAAPAPSAPAASGPRKRTPKCSYIFSPAKHETAPSLPTREITAKAKPLPPPLIAGQQVSMLGTLATARTVDPKAGGKGSTAEADPFQLPERYRLDQEIGKGGMGVVYKAQDLLLERPVAIKLLHSFGTSGDTLRQFLMEARAIARLSHPHVIHVFDMGIMGVQHYIAMEYITGQDLRQHVQAQGKLSVKEALRLFIEMGEGLAAAHEAGIVHRDIKPGNVLLTQALEARIVDFGLAKLQHHDEPDREDTIFKSAGTPGFMAPEQIRGETVGPPADIYALGITLFQMLVGTPPHRVKNVAGAEKIISFQMAGELPSLKEHRPDVPPAIDQLYRYCTATHVGDRFQEIKAFLPTARQWMSAV